jgi:hypothetical protein
MLCQEIAEYIYEKEPVPIKKGGDDAPPLDTYSILFYQGVGSAQKFCLFIFAPLMVTALVGGLKVYPLADGMTV